MTRFAVFDLASLPYPGVVETLDMEAIVTSMRDDLVSQFPAIIGVIDLESEPARKLIEVFAYREVLLRARINDAARQRMLAFAAGANLDAIAAYYGVSRFEGETDASFRRRTQSWRSSSPKAGAAKKSDRGVTVRTRSTSTSDRCVLKPASVVLSRCSRACSAMTQRLRSTGQSGFHKSTERSSARKGRSSSGQSQGSVTSLTRWAGRSAPLAAASETPFSNSVALRGRRSTSSDIAHHHIHRDAGAV